MKKMCGVMFLIAKVKTDFNVLWYWFVSHYCKSLSFISATNFNMKKNHRWKDAPKSLTFKVDCSKEQPLVGLWSDLFILLCLCLVFDTTHLSVSLISFLSSTSKYGSMVHMSSEQSLAWPSAAWDKDQKNVKGTWKFLKDITLMSECFSQWKLPLLIKEMKVK